MTSEEMMNILLEKIAGLEAKVESMKEQEGVLVYDTKGLRQTSDEINDILFFYQIPSIKDQSAQLPCVDMV